MPEHQQRESGSPFANAIPHQVDRFNSLVPLFVPEVKWTMTSCSFGENPSVCSTLSTNVFGARCFNVVLFACCLPASRLAHHCHGKRDLSFRLNSVANVRSTTNVIRRELFQYFSCFISLHVHFWFVRRQVFHFAHQRERRGSPLVLQVDSRTQRDQNLCLKSPGCGNTRHHGPYTNDDDPGRVPHPLWLTVCSFCADRT